MWILGICGLFVIRSLRNRSVTFISFLFFLFCTCVIVFVPPKVSVALLAAGWAYFAAAKNHSRVIRFFHLLLVLGVLEALLGLIQYSIAPGWIFGYINNFYRTSGTLINRNHFAGLLEMLIPIGFGLAYSAARRFGEMARPYLYLLASSFMGLGLLFSVSRMGIFSFVATVLFLGFVLRLRTAQHKLSLLLASSTLGLVLAGALWIGIDVIVARYSELVGQDAILREGRVLVFRDAIRMIGSNPLGVGPGNFQDYFRRYQIFRPDLLFDHAHNDYLETAAEWGIPLAAFFWIFVFFVLIRGVRVFTTMRSPEGRGILLACVGAIFSILVHSLTDFNLQIPSNAMLFFSFIGISLACPVDESGDFSVDFVSAQKKR
jgi:hypothetical protein